jgi:flagellum-specific peptidoglycan hydrolase FlgJ
MATQRELFIQKMLPYAKRASQATNIPVSVILAQWGVESADGTSNPTKYNNYAGIMYTSRADFKGGMSTQGTYFSGYNSIDSFSNDYIKIMNFSMYGSVRNAVGVEDTVKALAASPYDAGHYGGDGSSILNYINSAGIRKYDTVNNGPAINLGDIQLVKGVPGIVLLVGASALAVAALLPKK